MKDPQPWSPRDATDKIREIAKKDAFTLYYKMHAKDQLSERNLIVSDVRFILKHGFVYEEPEPSTKEGFFKYKIESGTPNSCSRVVRMIVIPNEEKSEIKIVTIMWVDETSTRAGSNR